MSQNKALETFQKIFVSAENQTSGLEVKTFRLRYATHTLLQCSANGSNIDLFGMRAYEREGFMAFNLEKGFFVIVERAKMRSSILLE